MKSSIGPRAPRIRAVLALLLPMLLLGACGSDARKGTFVAGDVKGLHYETETRSGLTDENGTFVYQKGETVTFSIGGVVLGSAEGAREISPFDLFGVTPPATETELRAVLADYSNVSGFDRAANVAYLLVALDVDNDPDNGIDLTGRDEALADATLSFDVGLYSFPYRIAAFLRAHHIARDVHVPRALTHLYDALGIVVPAHIEIGSETDEDDDGSIDSSSADALDASGRSLVARYDDDHDGNDEYVYTRTYDAAGHVVESVNEHDANDDGTFDERSVSTSTYDVNGFETRYVYTTDSDADGTDDYVGTDTYTYDANGGRIATLSETDSNGDGVVDSRQTQTSTFDAAGNRVADTSENDSDGNGVVNSRSTNAYTHDAQGNVLTSVYESDSNADGVANLRQTETYTYDARGRVLTDVFESDSDANGVANSIGRSLYTYDAEGRQITSVYEYDGNADGTNESRSVRTFTYDASGHLVLEVYESDSDNDGVVNSRSTQEWTYDPATGLETQEIRSEDSNADGIPSSRYVTLSTYEDGVRTVEVDSDDDDGDGTVDDTDRTTTTYALIDDGVAALVHYYWD